MKRIIQVYFFLFLLSGGFRHFSFETEFYSTLNQLPSPTWVPTLSVLLAILAACYLMVQRSILILLFYIVLMVLEVYVQNFVKFESSVILIHQIPLFAFLFLHEKRPFMNEEIGRYAILLFISIGYVSSAMSKSLTGWFSLDQSVLRSHIQTLQYGFQLPVLIPFSSLESLPFLLWKLMDFIVVFFQLSFVRFFFHLKGLKGQFIGLIAFHLGISLLMGIHVFYPYFLVYILVFIPWKSTEVGKFKDRLFTFFGILYLILLIQSKGDTNGIIRLMPFQVYLYYDFILTVLLALVCLFVLRRFDSNVREEKNASPIL